MFKLVHNSLKILNSEYVGWASIFPPQLVGNDKPVAYPTTWLSQLLGWMITYAKPQFATFL